VDWVLLGHLHLKRVIFEELQQLGFPLAQVVLACCLLSRPAPSIATAATTTATTTAIRRIGRRRWGSPPASY
jgi:hypothetical protein